MARTKNSAAVELGRRGGLARARALSPEQRSDIARRAAHASHGKKPVRWYVVLAGDDPLNKFELLFASRDKQEVRDYARKVKGWIDWVDYDARGLNIIHRFKPDIDAQVAALKIAVEQKAGRP
jgi:hypothetical protein